MLRKALYTGVIHAIVQIIEVRFQIGVISSIRVRITRRGLHWPIVLVAVGIVVRRGVARRIERSGITYGVTLRVREAHRVRVINAVHHAKIDAVQVDVAHVIGVRGGIGGVQRNHAVRPDRVKGGSTRLPDALIADVVSVIGRALGACEGCRAVEGIVGKRGVLGREGRIGFGEFIARGVVGQRDVVHDVVGIVHVRGDLRLQAVRRIVGVRCQPVHGRGVHIRAAELAPRIRQIRAAIGGLGAGDGGTGVLRRDDVVAAVVSVDGFGAGGTGIRVFLIAQAAEGVVGVCGRGVGGGEEFRNHVAVEAVRVILPPRGGIGGIGGFGRIVIFSDYLAGGGIRVPLAVPAAGAAVGHLGDVAIQVVAVLHALVDGDILRVVGLLHAAERAGVVVEEGLIRADGAVQGDVQSFDVTVCVVGIVSFDSGAALGILFAGFAAIGVVSIRCHNTIRVGSGSELAANVVDPGLCLGGSDRAGGGLFYYAAFTVVSVGDDVAVGIGLGLQLAGELVVGEGGDIAVGVSGGRKNKKKQEKIEQKSKVFEQFQAKIKWKSEVFAAFSREIARKTVPFGTFDVPIHKIRAALKKIHKSLSRLELPEV